MAVSVTNCVNFQNTAKNHETSTGRSHRFIPSVPQEFDCRVKASIKQDTLYKEIEIKNEQFKTNYYEDYPERSASAKLANQNPPYERVNYMRNVQEEFFLRPPQCIKMPLSEMKDNYRIIYHKPRFEEDNAPCKLYKCYVQKLGSEQQPAIPINGRGFWKLLDPYLSTYKGDYIPGGPLTQILNEKVLTFYNVGEFELPPRSGNKTMFDRSVFKNVLPLRLFSRAQKRVPNFGMQSEYQDHYVKQTYSYLYPYLEDRCTTFDDSLPDCGRFQNLAPPGMYCTEYCNYGGKSVRATVEPAKEKRHFRRADNCCPVPASKR